MEKNYFEVLKLDIEEDLKNLKSQSESEFNEFKKDVIKKFSSEYSRVKNAAEANERAGVHSPAYSENKKDFEDQIDHLGQAKNTLINRDTRDQHIDDLLKPDPDPIPIPDPDPHVDPPPRQQSKRTIVKFRNGDEATSIPELATLMEKNTREATDILYAGDLASALAGAGETTFAPAARAVVSQFSGDRQIGLMAMLAILRKKIKFKRFSEASTPQQLARSIDQNWEEAKTLLYNGFIGLWFQHAYDSNIASTVQKVVNTYRDNQDRGLEELVQRLDPNIGEPELEISHSEIDFGNMNSESQKTIQFKIKNVGRGYLYGDVQLTSNMPGLQISNTEIQRDGAVTIELDARELPAKQKHQTSLVVDTNGETVEVPVSCYITYPVQNSIHRLAISGFSLAAISLVTRFIILQFGSSGWLSTHLTGEGFIEWRQVWQWDKWFEWPWFEWSVYAMPKTGIEFIIALAVLGSGLYVYWHFLFKKKGMSR